MGCFGKKYKKYRCTIVLLDETDIVHEIESKTTGEELMEYVFKHLNLLETSYFGLRYINKSGESRWLDRIKSVVQQMKNSNNFTFYFGVKFYASDPCKLQEEITRYQFVLQVKQDIFQGRLQVPFELGAELFALSLQSELGDYDTRKHDIHYVSEFRFLPNQNSELEDKVASIHKSLVGQVPSKVEMTFLDKVKWLDMYGVDLHVVMGEDSVEYFLCMVPSGIVVMKNGVKVSNYFWPRITKAFFKGKYFMLRIRNKTSEESTYAFELSSKDACKYLWRCCIEHHSFFRLSQVKELSALPINIFRLGSKHRYSGRTEQQIKIDMRNIKRQQPSVVRVPSKRYPKRLGEPDGAEAEETVEEHKTIPMKSKDDLMVPHSTPTIVVPLYRSVSTPAELPTIHSDKTQKSAPWEDTIQQGLFANSSHRSLCSSQCTEKRRKNSSHKRSPSVNSEESTKHHRRRHRSRKNSDNESDISKSSKGSRASKSSRGSTSHRRARHYSQENENEPNFQSKQRSRKHRSRSCKYGATDSDQLRMVQKTQENNENWPQNAVVRDLSARKSGYVNSGIDTESEVAPHRRKHRRHSRSRSRSPDKKNSLTGEIKKHIKYSLIDSSLLTEEEKKEIKFTNVQTVNEVVKVQYSPTTGRPHYKVLKMSTRSTSDKGHMGNVDDDPPPPYTPSQISNFCTKKEEKQTYLKTVKQSPTSYSTILLSGSSNGSLSNALKSRHPSNVGHNKEQGKEIRNSQDDTYNCSKMVHTRSRRRHELRTEL